MRPSYNAANKATIHSPSIFHGRNQYNFMNHYNYLMEDCNNSYKASPKSSEDPPRKKGSDLRYSAVRVLIKDNSFRRLSDIFKILPKSILASDLDMNYKSLLKKVHHPRNFTMEDMVNIAYA